MDIRQRHIIQTVFDKTGLEQYTKYLKKASKTTARVFGNKIPKDAKYAGTAIRKSFNKAGEVVTKRVSTFVKEGTQMKVAWSQSAKGAKFLGVSVSKVSGAMGKFNAILGKAVTRALVVAPVWLAIRSSMMLMLSTIRETVQAYIDLDDGMARIKTVMHGTRLAIEGEMIAIRRQIIEMALKSRISLKNLTEGFYFLKTANLNATEAMSAFAPTVDLAIGTMNSMGESARAVAGVYNTMGKYIGDRKSVV